MENNDTSNNNEHISINDGEITAVNGGGTGAYTSLMERAEMSPYINDDLSEEEEEDDDDAAGGLEEYAEDDSNVSPAARTAFILMCAKASVDDFDMDEFVNLAERAGQKNKTTKFTRALAIAAIKLQNPRTKFSKKNTKLNDLVNMILPFDEEKDIAYIKKKVAAVKECLLNIIAAKEAEASATVYITSANRLRWIGLHLRDDVLELFHRSQDASTREQMDASESPNSEYHQLVTRLFNDDSVVVNIDPLPSLGYPELIVGEKGDYVMTEEKSKKLANDIRRHLNNIIARYELSGNGSNQAAHNRGELELEEGVSADTLWGRTIHAQRDAAAAADTEAGDDRINFLRSEPKDTAVAWHVFDTLDMIRKVCSRLGEGDGASSESTPSSTARGSRSRRNIRDTVSGAAANNMEMDSVDVLFYRCQKMRRLDRQMMVTQDRLHQLESERFELFMRAEDEVMESKRDMLNNRAAELTEKIKKTRDELQQVNDAQVAVTEILEQASN